MTNEVVERPAAPTNGRVIRKYKISVLGAGNVGGTCAKFLAEKDIGDVVLMDIAEGVPQGKALDMMQSGPIRGFSSAIHGSNCHTSIADSDIVVVTAGKARTPGMSREDLIRTNAEIVSALSRRVKEVAPDAIILVVTNPLDIMSYVAFHESGFEPHKVFGMAGVLDSCRYKTFIAMELGISPEDVQAMVLGGHGDSMVPLVKYATAGGVPISEILDSKVIEQIVERTKHGGAEIVGLLKTGSAFYAPAAAAAQMVEAILKDKKRVLPVSAYLQGEYGINGVHVGVPVVLGANGVERIIELDLEEKDLAQLQSSAEIIKKHVAELGYL